jgi:hypothetical protein
MFALLLLASASALNYNVQVFDNDNCSGVARQTNDILLTSSDIESNNSVCSDFTFNASIANVSLRLSCDTNWPQLTAYDPATVSNMSNCTTMSQGERKISLFNFPDCTTFSTYPGLSFNITNNGGPTCKNDLSNISISISITCVSGDTLLATPEGAIPASKLEIGTEIMTPDGFKPVQVFWHRGSDTAACLRVCPKHAQDCVVLSPEHYVRASTGFEMAKDLPEVEFVVSPATCDGLVSFSVRGGSFLTQGGGVEVSCFSKTWGLGHDSLKILTEWSPVLWFPIDWTIFAEAMRCAQNKGWLSCLLSHSTW